MNLKNYLKTQSWLTRLRQWWEYTRWQLGGQRGGAPHLYKQSVVRQFGQTYQLRSLVETGTYLGEMVYAMKDEFKNIYSIELAHSIFARAKLRFANFFHVRILEGNSEDILPDLLEQIKEPALFWLDGHYSGGETARGEQDTPILQELRIILERGRPGSVILIDDARLFVGHNGYPTLEQLNNLVAQNRPELNLAVAKDLIRIFPKTDA